MNPKKRVFKIVVYKAHSNNYEGLGLKEVMGQPITLAYGGKDFFAHKEKNGWEISDLRYGANLNFRAAMKTINEAMIAADRLLKEVDYQPGMVVQKNEDILRNAGISLPVNQPINKENGIALAKAKAAAIKIKLKLLKLK